MIMENTISLGDTRPTGVLPDRQTANILVESFFTNVRDSNSLSSPKTTSPNKTLK